MIAALSKPIDDLKSEDLQELVSKGWSESENVEFKSGLSARQNAKDPWYGGGKVEELAKERLFKEIVAFANRSGGPSITAVQESAQKPPSNPNYAPATMPRAR